MNQKNPKLLCSTGPIDTKIHYSIPFEKLPWAVTLIQAVDAKQAVLLHGHWQSGKTSALRFLKVRAEEQGIKVYVSLGYDGFCIHFGKIYAGWSIFF
jgi:hypothetical protein